MNFAPSDEDAGNVGEDEDIEGENGGSAEGEGRDLDEEGKGTRDEGC
ncbi:hypothetical protein EUTSA_v10009287mg [Eutrema salsugineum]|uniref:Uncharacterized protein n=1 Tax=Eutrema salsugineum TaxID=72664 RepID=V4L101_EUTSA|nr:hypothetical protein EUTSA_v10009287mg [Eutrema salsugineum]